jgi:2-polyprenyl-3-methyl-5-hydroxy-6-metoxy-1,4-benzoquinol methylase
MMRYTFEPVAICEMCADSTANHKILGQRLNQSQGLNPKNKEGISVTVKKCTNCELIYSSPQPIPFDIQDHYGMPPEDYWRPEEFIWHPDNFGRQIKDVKPMLGFKEGMKALDIGAGLGKIMISLDKAGFDAYGLEPSKPFLENAISKMGIKPEKLKLGMMEEIDYPENEFDFITYSAVFEHLYHPAACLERSLKWVKPGGIIHIEVPSSKHFMAKLIDLYYRLRGTTYVTHLSPMHPPFHLYEYGLKSFEELGKKLNYSIAYVEYTVCEISYVPGFLKPLFRWYMDKTKTGMQLAVYLRKNG